MSKIKLTIKILCVLTLVLFFFPLCTVSCSDMATTKLTGYDIAFGKELSPQNVVQSETLKEFINSEEAYKTPASPTVAIALFLAGFTVLVVFIMGNKKILPGVTSLLVCGLMILSVILLKNQATKQSGGIIDITLNSAFYLMIISTLATSALCFFAKEKKKEAKKLIPYHEPKKLIDATLKSNSLANVSANANSAK